MVGGVKAGSSLGCSDCEIVKFRVVREGSKPKIAITTLDFRRTEGLVLVCSGLFLEESHVIQCQRGLGMLVDFQ